MTRTSRILIASTVLLLAGGAGTARAQQPKEHEHQRAQRGREHARAGQPQPSAQAQQQRMDKARRREAAYRATLDREVGAEQQRAAELQQARREAQYRAQQQYLANLRAQQARIRAEREDQYRARVLAPSVYRYRRAGVEEETSEYGAQALRRAVQLGYQQGYRAGQADRDDRGRFDYRDNYAYLDANYGYEGLYLPETDYNYYFREGFRRGYEDGYYARYQYGSLLNGVPSILGAVLSSILGLVPLR